MKRALFVIVGIIVMSAMIISSEAAAEKAEIIPLKFQYSMKQQMLRGLLPTTQLLYT